MEQSTIRRGRYAYVHDVNGSPPEAIDVHHILVSNTWGRMSHLCTFALLFTIPGFLFLHHPQGTLVAVTFWSLIFAGFLLWVSLRRQIKKGGVPENVSRRFILILEFSLRLCLEGSGSFSRFSQISINHNRLNLPESYNVLLLTPVGVMKELGCFYTLSILNTFVFYFIQISGRTVRHFVPLSKILKPVLVECVTPFSCYWSLSLIVRGEEELLPVLKGLYPPVKMLVPIWKALSVAIANGECNPTLDDSLPTGEIGT